MISDRLADDDLRALVIDTLNTDPGAGLDRIMNRLRSRTGRPLENAEAQRLEEIYRGEGFAAGASSINAKETARLISLASLSHARPNANEITGLVAGVLPLFVHIQSVNVSKTGGLAASSYFDVVALVGGVVAIIAGVSAVILIKSGPQRPFHIGVIGIVLLLGVYQALLGSGLLHRLGIYQFG